MCGIIIITLLALLLTRFGVPAGRDRKRSKTDALAEDGALNPAPEKVRDPKFQEGGFFDPGDIVQVIPRLLDQNRCAQSRSPMDRMRQG